MTAKSDIGLWLFQGHAVAALVVRDTVADCEGRDGEVRLCVFLDLGVRRLLFALAHNLHRPGLHPP